MLTFFFLFLTICMLVNEQIWWLPFAADSLERLAGDVMETVISELAGHVAANATSTK